MIYLEKPKDFDPKFEVVSCFCEYEREVLLLFRVENALHPRKWGLPAGSIKGEEGLKRGMARELQEETGIIVSPKDLVYLGKVYTRHPQHDFPFYTYRVVLKQKPEIKLNMDEHTDYIWVTPSKALQMDLILDCDEIIKIYYNLDSRSPVAEPMNRCATGQAGRE